MREVGLWVLCFSKEEELGRLIERTEDLKAEAANTGRLAKEKEPTSALLCAPDVVAISSKAHHTATGGS